MASACTTISRRTPSLSSKEENLSQKPRLPGLSPNTGNNLIPLNTSKLVVTGFQCWVSLHSRGNEAAVSLHPLCESTRARVLWCKRSQQASALDVTSDMQQSLWCHSTVNILEEGRTAALSKFSWLLSLETLALSPDLHRQHWLFWFCLLG